MHTVEFRFAGDPSEVRDIAMAMRDGLRDAQKAGRYADAVLVSGPVVSTTGSGKPADPPTNPSNVTR